MVGTPVGERIFSFDRNLEWLGVPWLWPWLFKLAIEQLFLLWAVITYKLKWQWQEDGQRTRLVR